jgi:hypothetical protein
LVRHGLPLVDISPASFRSLPFILQPTLLIDQELMKPQMLRLLLASNKPNANIPGSGEVANAYCAKAIYLGPTLGDHSLSDTALHIHLTPTRAVLPIVDAATASELTDKFQSMLLTYRFTNIKRVSESRFDFPNLAAGTRILARLLGACIIDAPGIQQAVRSVVQNQEEHLEVQRWLDPRCIAIEALMFHCHKEVEEKTYIGKITETAVAIFQGRGGAAPKAREIGDLVRSLGFIPKRKTKGWEICLTDDVRQRIHKLARDFNVAAVCDGINACKYCAAIDAAGEYLEKGDSPSARQ